jgi:hypothetical protein
MDAMIRPRMITDARRVQRCLFMCHKRAHAIEILDRWIVRAETWDVKACYTMISL